MGGEITKEQAYATPDPPQKEPKQEPAWADLDPTAKTGISAEIWKAIAEQINAAGPQGLPNQGKLEGLFKRSLSGIKVYTGISKLRDLGADAVASKDEIIFAGGMPDERTLSHEIIHVLQYGGGGDSGAEISSASDAAETEARKLAKRAALGLGEFVNPGASPSAKLSKVPAGEGGEAGGGTPPPKAPVQVAGGDVTSGGADWRFVNEGGWRSKRERTYEDGDLDEVSEPNMERKVTLDIAGDKYEVKTPEDWALIADKLGDETVDNIAGSYEVGGFHANALAEYAVTTEKVELKAGAAANITLAAGKLVLQTDEVALRVLNEQIKGRVGVELEAAAVAEVSGEVGLAAGVGNDGPEASLSGEAKAFAGGKAGIRGFVTMKWTPESAEDQDVAGASIGVEGWAGAAAAAKLEISLIPELKASGYYAAALGWGAGAKAEIKVHVVNSALLSLTLAGRGLARALDGIGLDAVSQAVDRMLDSLWIDDAARGVANSDKLAALNNEQCKDLINKMLDGATLNEDEQAILKVLQHVDQSGGLRTVVYGVQGGYYRLLDSFHGDEYDQLLELLYVSQRSVDDIPINDDVARSLIEKGLHQRMSVHRVRLLINELLEGFTANADEDALLKVCRDRSDVLTRGLVEDILANLHGSQDAALRGFLWLEGKYEGVDVDDDCARAIINHDMHRGVTDITRLDELIDALNAWATGNDDEAAIIKLLTDVPDYVTYMSEDRLRACLSNVDGEEYEQLLVALRRPGKITFLRDGIDFDDNVARLAVDNDLHKGVMNTAENTRAIRELLAGYTGDADERSIVGILKENMSTIRAILPIELAEEVKDNVHGAEYDELMAVFVTANYMASGVTVDDNVTRAMVRLGLHTHTNNRTRLLDMIDELLAGWTGDDDERAILSIIRDCPSVRPEITDEKLGQIADNVHGAEYTELVVLLRQTGRIDLASAPVQISIDDDIARAVVDQLGVAALSTAEHKKLIEELNAGFTGNADEARILTIVRESDVLTAMSVAEVDTTLDNVHGEEREELFLLIVRKARDKFRLPHDAFDDNCARRFVDENLHIDSSARLTEDDCKALINAMLDGFTGNDDEQRILTVIDARSSVVDKLSSSEVDRIHANLHGEEQETFFVWLARHNKLDWNNLHGDFDDNTARRFVDENLHVEHGATTDRRKALIDKMVVGFTGNADEDRILQILDADATLMESKLEEADLKTLLDNFDGAQNTALWLRIARAHRVDLSWPEYQALGFDDNVARAIIDENLHAEFSGEDLKKMLDEMTHGWVGDEDEQRSLSILRDHWDKVESHLDQRFIRTLTAAFHGEEFDRLMALLFIHDKLPESYRQEPHLNDRVARGLIHEGHHTDADLDDCVRIYEALIAGMTGNADEQVLLKLLTDRPELLDHAEVTIDELYSNFHGVEEAKLLVLLVDQGRLELGLRDPRIDDEAIREFVKQGKHRDEKVSTADLNELAQRLLSGATIADDEVALIDIVKARESSLNEILQGIDMLTLHQKVDAGDNGHELMAFLYEKSYKRADIMSVMLTDRARYFVDNSLTDDMETGHVKILLERLANGLAGDYVVQVLRQRSADMAAIAPDVAHINWKLSGEPRGEANALIWEHGTQEQKNAVLDQMPPDVGVRFVRQSLFESMNGEQMRKLCDALLKNGDATGNRNAVLVVSYAAEQGQQAVDALVGDDQERFLALFNDTYRQDVEQLIGAGGGGEQASDEGPRQWPLKEG